MSDEVMNATKLSLKDFLLSKGLSPLLIDELAMAAARDNYGQTPENLHGLVGESVSICTYVTLVPPLPNTLSPLSSFSPPPLLSCAAHIILLYLLKTSLCVKC